MKKFLVLFIALLVSFVLFSCDKEEDVYEIAVVTDVGQLNDGGFNQGTWEGAKAFAEANNMTYKYYQPAQGADATDNDRIAAMNQAIENGAKVIVTPGFMQQAAIAAVAPNHPDVKFVFVDGWTFGEANVTAISYKEQESGYFAGYAAVMDGYTKLGGTFGGGGANPACNRFCYGYIQGIKAAAEIKGANVEVRFSFQYGAQFSASPQLATQISGWYQAGTQVVFSCGGSMLDSVKQAAAEHQGAKIIGVDVDQADRDGYVITSAVKGLRESVQLVLSQWKAGEWDAKLANKESKLGAAENATGLPTAEGSWRFTSFTVAQYQELFNGVKNGTIAIDDNAPAEDPENPDSHVWATWAATAGDSRVTVLYE